MIKVGCGPPNGLLCRYFPDFKGKDDTVPAVPSFEAFFGAASDVLYYHPEAQTLKLSTTLDADFFCNSTLPSSALPH